VRDDVTRSPVVAGNQTCNLMFNDDTCGVEDGGEGVDDVVVALVEESGLDARGLMDSFLVVVVVAVAAFGRSSDLSESVLHDLFKDVRGNFRTEVLVGDCEVDGTGDEAGCADDASL
jgi:hypothetical protein